MERLKVAPWKPFHCWDYTSQIYCARNDLVNRRQEYNNYKDNPNSEKILRINQKPMTFNAILHAIANATCSIA